MKTNQVKNTLLIFWRHTARYWPLVLLIIISMISAEFAQLYRPILYKHFFDLLPTLQPDNANQLIDILLQLLSVLALGWVFWRICTFTDVFLIARVMSNLHNTSFKYLLNHSYNYFNNNFSGSLVRKVNRYTRAYEEIADQLLWNVSPTVITLIFILTVLFKRDPLLTYVLFVWIIIYVFFSFLFVKYKLKYDIKRAEADTLTTGHLSDTVANHINLKLFASTEREFGSFFKLTENLFNIRRLTWNLDNIAEAVQGGLMIILEFGIMYVAVIGWKKGIITIGDFALIQAYLINMFDNLWGIGRYFRKIYSSLADADEMTEILTLPHEVVDVAGATRLQVEAGKIIFDQVTFNYSNYLPIFNKFNLTIRAHERVALIGPSGSGKSTLVKLVLRFFDIQSGKILIDDQNISLVTQDSLHEKIAVVPQDPVLFHRTLMENIRYAKPSASDRQVIEAAKLAHCHEFISQFPDKYETYVGERGVKLSGGERQRVAIARAILQDAPILVLDEATSSLDSESERYIQAALKHLMKNKTTIVIAHRLSTVMQMDRIIVLKDGKIVEEGTHDDLLKKDKGLYQKLWGIQAGGFSTK